MCGIVASTSTSRNILPLLLEGLRRLEYRGYDSCGIAAIDPAKKGLYCARSVARVADLSEQVKNDGAASFCGISHTRWATHGATVVRNAHPHISHGLIALVHNGIIENFKEIREKLAARGFEFSSQTDTEIVAHLIYSNYEGDLLEAVKKSLPELRGSYGFAILSAQEPGTVVVARKGSPLVVGLGDGEMFAASDAMALAGETNRIIYLEEGDLCRIRPEEYAIYTRRGEAFEKVERPVKVVEASSNAVDLGPYQHYMQKEIFEQPHAISETLEGVETVCPEIFGPGAETIFRETRRILMLACGTSYYAALTSKYWIEELAGVPVDVEIASEYRYRASVPSPDTLVVTISQSGETADTLSALKHARDVCGMTKTLTICNVSTSAMVRESRLAYITRAGVEIGVASTKAFTTQLVALYFLALTFAKLRGRLPPEQEAREMAHLKHLPSALSAVLALEPQVIAWADQFAKKQDALFLGRGLHYPIALEGALKLKEISYIHAEAYPAGELKHGPLALVDSTLPVVIVAPSDELLEKLKSNMMEVRARGGELFVFADSGTEIELDDATHVIRMPEYYGRLSPVLHVVPLQLLAYHTALARGTNVDRPRNLAKSVTVE